MAFFNQDPITQWSPTNISEVLSPSMLEDLNKSGTSSQYADLASKYGYNYVEGDRGDGDGGSTQSGWFMGASERGDGAYNDPYANSLSNMYQRYDSETGNWSPNNSYSSKLGEFGYVPTNQKLSAVWKSPETLNWFNQNYGTNFQSPLEYAQWIYGGGNLVNDPLHGELFKLPEGRGISDYVNKPLSYEKSEWFDTVIPGLIGGVALAGMGGFLPGTESIFGGAAAGSGAGAGSLAGGLDGALADSVLNYTAGMGANASPWGAAAGATTGAGGMDWSRILSDTGSFTGEFNPLSMNAESLLQTIGSGNANLGSILNSVTSGAAGGGSWSDQLWNTLKSGLSPSSGKTPFDGGQLISSFLNYFAQNKYGNQLDASSRDAAAAADPFAGQRGFYQDQLKQSYTDPNFFTNSPQFQGILQNALRSTQANNAAAGYLKSGNMLHDLTRTASEVGYKYALPWQQQTGGFAGAGFGPGQAGNILATGGQAAAQQDYDKFGNLGATLQQIYRLFS